LSDGLAKDIHALRPAGSRPLLFGEVIPRRAGADLRASLTDGEDYELLFTLRGGAPAAARLLAAWRRAFPRVPLTVIGQLAGRGTPLSGAIDLSAYSGFEHLKS
jgi:thiamine-monophosphate kinase